MALVPVSAAAAAADVAPAAGINSAYKDSWDKRAKRAAQTPVATAVSAPRTAPAPTVAPVATFSDRVLALTNAERTARGLRPLAFSTCADNYANSWAATLSRVGSLSHQALSPILSACRASGAGENVAYGNVTPEGMVKMWMDSPGHRANILDASFTHLGVGAVTTSAGRVYSTQVFLDM